MMSRGANYGTLRGQVAIQLVSQNKNIFCDLQLPQFPYPPPMGVCGTGLDCETIIFPPLYFSAALLFRAFMETKNFLFINWVLLLLFTNRFQATAQILVNILLYKKGFM